MPPQRPFSVGVVLQSSEIKQAFKLRSRRRLELRFNLFMASVPCGGFGPPIDLIGIITRRTTARVAI